MENFECASECNHLKTPLLYRIIENYRIIEVGKTLKITYSNHQPTPVTTLEHVTQWHIYPFLEDPQFPNIQPVLPLQPFLSLGCSPKHSSTQCILARYSLTESPGSEESCWMTSGRWWFRKQLSNSMFLITFLIKFCLLRWERILFS